MSFETQAWAKAQRTGSVGCKAVLMALAEYADERHSSFPSQERLAFDTEQSVSTVYRYLKALTKMGLVIVEQCVDADTKRRKTNRYVLRVEPSVNLTGGARSTGHDEPKPIGQMAEAHLFSEEPREKSQSLSSDGRRTYPLPSAVQDGRAAYPDEFETVWRIYPPRRNNNKFAAYRMWYEQVVNKAKKQNKPAERRIQGLYAAVVALCEEIEDRGTEEQYIPHASTFFSPKNDNWKPYARRELARGPAT